MKTRREKHSEAFWPSVVMKKWLNIKPKVHDFSEDEVDTETEGEDDAYSVKDSRLHRGEDHICWTLRNLSECRSQISVAPSKGYRLRPKRGKSETLRAQYINTKDVRVTIGTWNVAGRLPSEDLEIDDWLCTEEPADIYIIGFQEVVPLNAGNVLGAEDSKPIPKWEAIIRTLNKSLEPRSKHKCYSASPYPVLRTSSVADVLADEIDTLPLKIMCDEYLEAANAYDFEGQDLNKVAAIGQNLRLKRINGIDCDTRLDWPEHQKDGAEQRRNSDVYEIIRRTRFSSVLDTDQPQTITSHDKIFWFGDLNYCLNKLDVEVGKLVALKCWNELINNDQFHKELCSGHVFDGWKEGVVNFPPAYKYEMNLDRYVGEIPTEGEKNRSPAWCDLILWSGKGIKQLCYQRTEIRLSDHRPVSSIFLFEVLDHWKLQRALNVSIAAVQPEIFCDEK